MDDFDSKRAPTRVNIRDILYRIYCFVVLSFILFVIVICLLSFCGTYSPKLELISNLRFQLTVVLLMGIPFLIPVKKRVLMVFPLLVLVLNLIDIVPLCLPASGTDSPAILSVLTANVNKFNQDNLKIASVLQGSNADVVCVHELTPKLSSYLSENLKDYPYNFLIPEEGFFGIGIFSKFELTGKQTLRLSDGEMFTQVVTVNIGGGKKVDLINTHPIAPLNDDYSKMRNLQLDNLAKLARNSTYPVVLVGDLNVTQFSPYFKTLVKTGKHQTEKIHRR